MIIGRILRSKTTIFAIAVVVGCVFTTDTSFALSDRQKEIYDLGIPFFDLDNSCLTPDSPTPLGGSDVYIIGDSLTVGMKALEGHAAERGLNVLKIEATEGDTIGDAIPKIENDKDIISEANTVVVALGTNPAGISSDSNLPTLIEKIREYSDGVAVQWVNIHTANDNYQAFNTFLESQSTELDFSIIDYAAEAEANPDIYDYAEDGVHLGGEGYVAKSRFVVSQISDTSASLVESTQPQTDCTCSSGSFELTGDEIKDKVWNFLIDQGFEPYQVAGIMGNMVAESGINPRRVQNTPTPEGDSDYPPSGASIGYGLVQWTPGTQLLGPAEEAGAIPGDLAFQLDYLMHELNNEEKAAYDHLLATTNVDEAARSFMIKFERPADQSEGKQQHRVELAEAIMVEFGGSASGTGSSAAVGSHSCGSLVSAVCEGNTSLPIPEDVEIQWFNANNHGTSVSYPPKTNGHNTILYNTNDFGAESIATSSYDVGEASDVGLAAGTKIFSPTDGTVLYSGTIRASGSDGYMVIIESSNKKCVSLSAHLNAPTVAEGDTVSPGQEVGVLTGSGVTPHIHFELWVEGEPINIGEDPEPCSFNESCANFAEKAEQIWDEQVKALSGGEGTDE